VGITSSTWSNYEVGKSEPNTDVIVKIASALEVSVDELLTSKSRDAPLISEAKETYKRTPKRTPFSTPNSKNPAPLEGVFRAPSVITVDSQEKENVLFVPVKAHAGYLVGYADQEYIGSLPAYSLPGLAHGTYRMFEVLGHSMVPTIHESDVIVARWVENLLEIRDNRVYVVLTQAQGVVVKRVINRVQTEGKLILNSDNQRHAGDYPPIIIEPEQVLEIWYAVAYMSRQMREPGELYNRLIDVETRLTLLEGRSAKINP
jgi:phage repressor protein C with HTH and peptisase S24 domain